MSDTTTTSKNWFVKHKVLSVIAALVVIGIIISAATMKSPKTNVSNTAGTTTAKTSPKSTTATTTSKTSTPQRQVKGTAVTLGAGTFTGGKDVAVGLYDVTAGAGQTGNFIVDASDGTNTYNEVLGAASDGNVTKIRTQINSGDQIQLSGISSVTFTPVTAAFVTSKATTDLYAGTFIVGQDIGAGRYVVTPASGESGNFIVDSSDGTNTYNEVLGAASDGDVPSVTATLNTGDEITLSGIDQVIFTPTN